MSTMNASAMPDGPPYVGALLRMCLQIVRSRMQEAAREAGFTDLQAYGSLGGEGVDAQKSGNLVLCARRAL